MADEHIQVTQEGDDMAYEPQGDVILDNGQLPMGQLLRAALSAKRSLDNSHEIDEADNAVDAMESLESLRYTVGSLQSSSSWNSETQKLTRLTLESVLESSTFFQKPEILDKIEAYLCANEDVEVRVVLESLDDILSVMSDHVSAGFGRLKQSILSSLGNLAASFPHLETRWRKMEAKLRREAVDQHGEIRASGIYKYFLRQGKLPSDLEGYLKEYASYVELIATHFDRDAQVAIARNADQLATIEFDTLEHFERSYEKASEKWMDPRKVLPEGIFDFVVPGGNPFFVDHATTYTGENKAIKFFDLYTCKHVPPKRNVGDLLRKYESVDHLEPLSLDAMRDLTKHFIEVTERIKLEWNPQSESLAHARIKAEFFGKRRENADKNIKHQVRQAYKYLDRAYGITYDLGMGMKFSVLHHFVKVSNALLTYMERSLNPNKSKEYNEEPL